MSWVMAGIASAALTAEVISMVDASQKADKEKKKLEEERKKEQERIDRRERTQMSMAKGAVLEDRAQNERQKQIDATAANTIGQVKGASKSTQEVINAAQKIQSNKHVAEGKLAEDAAKRELDAKKFIAERFTAAGNEKLASLSLLDKQTQDALNAIAANAQAQVDSTQSITSGVTSIAGSANASGAFSADYYSNDAPNTFR